MFRNKSVNQDRFAMVPRPDVPRAKFSRNSSLKTTIDASKLYPIYCEECLPGDTVRLDATIFGRLATPIFPVMDNVYLDTFFFFVPNRLLWANWVKFMGEQVNPSDTIAYSVPQITSPVNGYAVGSIYDYFGLPTVGQVGAGNSVTHSALPLRAYNLIYNQWFRDENLTNSLTVSLSDGPDGVGAYSLMSRGKRKDYFTSCLPWPQKGAASISIPLGTSAPVKSDGATFQMRGATDAMSTVARNASSQLVMSAAGTTNALMNWGASGASTTGLYTDLTAATAATINQLRQSFAIQKLLERDARGGTRYTEMITAHFGVRSPDARLQRPEYLGGGSSPVVVSPIAQTSASGLTGGSSPLGNLSGMGSVVSRRNGFTYSCVEHGYIIGLANVRADLSYQQGLAKQWTRATRYDFYFPAFAQLGEQAVLSKELYCDGSAGDNDVFGYQERWAEYRYGRNQITGLMRSTSSGTIDPWHLAQKFTARPVLNDAFIQDVPPLSRVLAVGAAANGQQLLLDVVFDQDWTRPLPMFSVPGLIDHF